MSPEKKKLSTRFPVERLLPHGKTQDLKVLQAILDEAKGQPGLAGVRKMLNKMVKRIKAVQVGGLLKVSRYGSTYTELSPLFEKMVDADRASTDHSHLMIYSRLSGKIG